jgi:hypothetical protein
VISTVKHVDYEVWVAEQVGRMIQFFVTDELPTDFNFRATLLYWLEQFELGRSRKTAEFLGTSQSALVQWKGGAIPRLRMTLNLCWVFGLSLLQFVERTAPVGHSGSLQPSVDAGARQISPSLRRRIEKPLLEAQLVEILRENRYAMMSLSEISRTKLRRRDMVVRQYFPALAHQIARRYLNNRKAMAELRQNEYCEVLKSRARFLHSRGVPPNHKTLSPYMEQPGKLRSAWAIKALHDVRVELGYEEDSEQLLLPI